MKPVRQHLHAVRHRLDRAQRRRVHHVGQVVDVVLRIRFVSERQMVVRVNQSGQHGEIRQVDHLGIGRRVHTGSDRGDAAVLDDDGLVGGGGAGGGIDEASSADHRRARRRGRNRRLRLGQEQETRGACKHLHAPGFYWRLEAGSWSASESVAERRKPNPVPAFAPCGATADDDHSSSPVITDGIKQPTRKRQTGRLLPTALAGYGDALPYLALLRAGFCLPSVLPRTRCALTAPFHPYPPCVRLRPSG